MFDLFFFTNSVTSILNSWNGCRSNKEQDVPLNWDFLQVWTRVCIMKLRILLIQKRSQPTVDYSNSVFEMWLEAMVDQRSSQLGHVCRESHTCCFLKILQHHWFHFQMTLLGENLLTFLLIFLEEYLVVGLLVLVFGRLSSKIGLKQGFLFLFQCWKLLM